VDQSDLCANKPMQCMAQYFVQQALEECDLQEYPATVHEPYPHMPH
jgi:hypothetical protein